MASIEWNQSALTTVARCGEAFRREYIEKEARPPRVAQVRGTVVHRVIGRTLLAKMANGATASADEARDLAADEFEGAWRSGVQLSDDERAVGVGVIKADAKDFAVDVAGFHAGQIAPSINPVAVERKIIVKPRDSDIIIHGTMDLIDRQADGEVIRDKKTATKSQHADVAARSLQLTMYGLLRLAEVQVAPVRYQLDYLIRTPVKHDLKHQAFPTTRSHEDFAGLVARLNMAVAAVQRGVFMPAPPDSWWCSREWCRWFDSCPYTAGGRRRPTS